MTQQVRAGYRRHRKATFLIVLAALAVTLGAIAPLATGAAPKYYTLTASPTATCSTPTSQTFTLVLTNQSRNNSLGSANITAPSYVSLINDGSATTSSGSITVNTPDSFDSTANTIRLRNLNLPTSGSSATITVRANVSTGSGGNWTSIVKQSNSFADSGPGNLFTLSGSAPTTTVSECHYAFTQGPVDASKNVAQPVTVQLQTSDGSKVSGSGSLSLTAYQGTGSNTALADGIFTGLTTSASNGQWSFSIAGAVTGTNYSLKAPDGTRSSYFMIADCIPDASGNCSIAFTPTGDGTSGASVNSSGVSSPIALAFSGIDTDSSGKALCTAGWNWTQLTFPPQPPDGRTTFDGTVLSDFSYAKTTGYLKVTTYLRNDLYVQTSASQTNDIQICAGAKHSSITNGAASDGFYGRGGIQSKWDSTTGLYWGVLARVSNCSKTPDANGDGKLDPVLCAWGTQTINGIDYRTATVLVPYDWDWKNVT